MCRVLLGVTGSIAVYKSLELIRLLKKEGYEVKVVMTPSAQKFITPLTFEALSRESVLTETTESWATRQNHIDMAKWADIFVIAPATVNTINKLFHGIGDTLLTQIALAFTNRLLIAPAANTAMYLHPTTQRSLQSMEYISPVRGSLACGDEGIGKMAEPIDIFHKIKRYFLSEPNWKNKNVLITSGGTHEKIDDVRVISNLSSGKMGEALAKALYYLGANVTLITSHSPKTLSSEITLIPFGNSFELKSALEERLDKHDFLFMAAAVSDYIPEYSPGKRKKSDIGEEMILTLTQNIDILASLPQTSCIKIGFKAEYDQTNGEQSAYNALNSKKLDAICLNYISDHPFGSDTNALALITSKEKVVLPSQSKESLAFDLAQKVVSLEY